MSNWEKLRLSRLLNKLMRWHERAYKDRGISDESLRHSLTAICHLIAVLELEKYGEISEEGKRHLSEIKNWEDIS